MYYHVSFRNDPYTVGQQKLFVPRVPVNGYIGEQGHVVEDTITPRVCLAPTIFGCLIASHYDDNMSNYNLYSLSDITIYAVKEIPNIFIPRRVIKNIPKHYKGIVPDCHKTREVWSLDPIKLTVVEKYNWNTMGADDVEDHQHLLLLMWISEYNKQMPKDRRMKVKD